jgi:alpha-beta hydrolase superfamily lysophospholipase
VTTPSRTADHPMLSPEGGNGAELRGSVPANPRGVVLVVHGGAETGTSRVAWHGMAVLRMVPFALAIHRRSGGDLAVLRLKNRLRGWNGPAQDPLVDAQWALDRVRRVLPGTPVALVGHSMGGRVVLRLADEPDVAGVVALAPWIAGDARKPRPGIPVLLMHGSRDRITDPARTAALARRFAAAGVDVRHEVVDGGDHPMLRQARRWHDTVADAVNEALRAPGRTS